MTMNYKSHNCQAVLIVFVSLANIIIFHGGCTMDVARCPCIIYKANRMADCAGINLKTVPGTDCIPADTRTLLLNNNRISDTISGMFQQFPDLQVLNLTGNTLHHIIDGSFTGLTNLTTLLLYNNKLWLNDSYSDLAFAPLTSLEVLQLQHNYIYSSCYYPDKALSNVPSIRNLTIDGVNGISLGEGFRYLKNLESLVFAGPGDTGFCYIDKMPLQMFHNIRETPVNTISLLDCEINQILPNTFANLRHLKHLTITYCRRLCAEGIFNITVGLNTTDIKSLQITHSCVYFPMNLPKQMFVGIRDTHLEVLDLSSDKIQVIDPDCIFDLPLSLTSVSLRDNFLVDAHFISTMQRLPNLVSFDVSYQSHFDANSMKTSPNNIKAINNELELKRMETGLHVNRSEVKNNVDSFESESGDTIGRTEYIVRKPRPASPFECLSDDSPIYLAPKLKYVYMSNMKLGYSVIPLTFGINNSLEYIDASADMLPQFLGPWKGLNDLKSFKLSNNRFQYIHEESFGYLPNLITLLLDGNELGKTIDVSANMLLNVTKLEFLNISNNGIKDLPIYFFRNQGRLKRLSVADNALIGVSFILDALQSLEELDLSNNQIQFLSEQNMRQLDRIAAGRKLTVNMLGNSFLCDCENKAYVEWLMNTNLSFTNKTDLTCKYGNGTVISFRDIGVIVDALNAECYAWIVVTACVVTFSALFLLSSLFATLYYKRWQLRYLYHVNRIRINPYNLLENEEIIQNNDVYISYNDYGDFKVADDLTLDQYVKTVLHRKLNNKGITVKIRDELQAGRKLADVIADAIRKSRKLLVLFNSSYCKDFWCDHEFNFAINEGIYTKRKVVIPIILGDINDEDIHPDILKVLQAEPVARYPGYKYDDAFVDFVECKIKS